MYKSWLTLGLFIFLFFLLIMQACVFFLAFIEEPAEIVFERLQRSEQLIS